jgi:uncharacterized protein YegP (UPF0339 family)
MAAKIEVFADAAGQWRWRLVAANGEIVASSEAYTTKASAVEGSRALRRAALLARLRVL